MKTDEEFFVEWHIKFQKYLETMSIEDARTKINEDLKLYQNFLTWQKYLVFTKI